MRVRKLALMSMIGLLASPLAMADPTVVLRYGEQSSFRLVGATLRLGAFWESDLGHWKASAHPEVEVAQISYRGSRSGATRAQLAGGGAVLRLVRGGSGVNPYAEIGLGGALFSRTSVGSKDFSTAFQFSQTVGLGVEFADAWLLGWWYSHYSNADIKRPNDGVDMHQLVLGARF